MSKFNTLKLTYKFDKRINDFKIHYPSKADGHLICSYMSDLVEKLEERGYDPKSVKFEISRKKETSSELCRFSAYQIEEQLKKYKWFLHAEPVLHLGGKGNNIIIWTKIKVENKIKYFGIYPVKYIKA